MQFDMTIFYTIASASASFVAILGGLIASKILSLNTERETLRNRLKELESEINIKTEERERLQKGLDEDDALDFIRDHCTDLVNREPLSNIYADDEQNRLTIVEIEPYWAISLDLVKKFDRECRRGGTRNDDNIPSCLASEVKDKPFEYDVCCEIAYEMFPCVRGVRNNSWYDRDQQRVYGLNLEIDSLQLEKERATTMKNNLIKPKGMSLGLWIFALFSVFNIIIPLICSMVITTIKQYNAFKVISIVTLGAGLVATLVYLATMLKWREKDE
jgi:hypothetical protein